ncbi:unnamed protein product [Brugia timori]|uniref:Transmembrane protein n=1 Tax=Brugia timori TaxID=42155 RepID=A0A0R3QW30_9BILA|nr:unnamed protein product [Brugia timori]
MQFCCERSNGKIVKANGPILPVILFNRRDYTQALIRNIFNAVINSLSMTKYFIAHYLFYIVIIMLISYNKRTQMRHKNLRCESVHIVVGPHLCLSFVIVLYLIKFVKWCHRFKMAVLSFAHLFTLNSLNHCIPVYKSEVQDRREID